MEMPVRNSVLWLNSVIPFLGKTVRLFVKVGMSSFFPAPATFPSGHPPTHQLIMHTPALLAAVTLAASLTALPARAADPALTIYNQGFAVHRETVPLELKAGVNDVRFAGVTAQVEADSVILRDPAGKVALQILEQNYRNDPVSQELLLSLFEGQKLDFVVHEAQKPDRVLAGKVVRGGYVPGGESVQPIIEVDGKLQFSLPGEPRFPTLGADTQLKPALSWRINAPAAAKLDAELAYITGGLTWEASYNLVAPEAEDVIDLVGWITMKNTSGATFTNAKIKLMAGDVNKVQPPEAASMMKSDKESVASVTSFSPPVVTEKAFDEFHLYTLARPATLRDKETKQVEFTRATGVKAARLFIYDPIMKDHGWQPGNNVGGDEGYGVTSSKKVQVYREFKNSEANKLGIPLPKGRVRFYSQDEDRQLEFVGENNIDHTPKNELVRLFIGDSFDLVGERKRTDFKANEGNHMSDETFEIKVRNRKKEAVEIRVVEHLYRWSNWTIAEKSQDFVKTDAQTIEFRVALKPDEEKVVTYKVHYTW